MPIMKCKTQMCTKCRTEYVINPASATFHNKGKCVKVYIPKVRKSKRRPIKWIK